MFLCRSTVVGEGLQGRAVVYATEFSLKAAICVVYHCALTNVCTYKAPNPHWNLFSHGLLTAC